MYSESYDAFDVSCQLISVFALYPLSGCPFAFNCFQIETNKFLRAEFSSALSWVTLCSHSQVAVDPVESGKILQLCASLEVPMLSQFLRVYNGPKEEPSFR